MNLQVNREHELDMSWLIALWFAIHGGDPSPEGGVFEVSEETYALAHGLVQNLLATYGRYGARPLSNAELEVRLREVVGMHHVPPSLVPKQPPPPPRAPDTGSGEVVSPSCWHISATQIRCWSVGSHSVAPTNPVKPE